MLIFWFGLIGATLTTASFLPQALLVLKTGNTEGISLTMYAMFAVGVSAWLGYGILLQSWQIIGANAVTLVFATLILTMKVRQTLVSRAQR